MHHQRLSLPLVQLITAVFLYTGLGLAVSLPAAMAERPVETTFDSTDFAGTVVWDDSNADERPALLMVPNWMGPTAASLKKAKKVAGMGYVVYMVDMYGVDVRPQNAEEASAAATTVRDDRPMMRRRAQHHLATLRGLAEDLPIDSNRIGAIGFCFGGGTVLELARSGAAIGGVVSFHGNLDTPDPAIAEQIQTAILVCHGMADPYVPMEQVTALVDEMETAAVDYQFVGFGQAVHSFTNPQADTPGKSDYDPQAAQRSFQYMNSFFKERFGPAQ